MPTEYYLWQWANNDLPGHPAQIVNQLATSDQPPAIQPFLVRRVYPRLTKVLDECRSELSEILVDPALTGTGAARFIRLRHPQGDSSRLADRLLWAVWDAELTVYNATEDRLIGLPKQNVVEYSGRRQFIDIEVADIPGLLHELSAEPGLSALTCYDQDGNMFQVWAHQGRYAVEWQVLPCRDFKLHRIWVAGRTGSPRRQARLGTVECGLDLFAQELMRVADVYQLWVAFLRGAPLPASHHWRDVTSKLDQLGQPFRYSTVSERQLFGVN
ncbi:MAG: hypothetical protein WCS70_06560 [Verrucomicrobiota bacterium]